MPVTRLISTLFLTAAILPSLASAAVAIPDFAGTWGRNAMNLETPTSGPGPIRNLRRSGAESAAPIPGGDPVPLVGDYLDPILKPQAAAVVKQVGEASASGHDIQDPSNQCHAYSPPYVLLMEQRVTVLQTKNAVTLVYSQDNQVRHVRLNGSHPAQVRPTPMGDSVGHYEGDTLVVDTVGIEVGPYTMVDRYGTPQSPAMHVVERYRLIDDKQASEAQYRHEQVTGRIGGARGNTAFVEGHSHGLQVHVTIDDPNTYTAPWSADVTYRFTNDLWEERICAENASQGITLGIEHPPVAEKTDF